MYKLIGEIIAYRHTVEKYTSIGIIALGIFEL